MSGTGVELSWSASAGATVYEVQRSSGIDDPYVTVLTPSTAGTYTDNVPGSGVFLYRVRASNSTGTSRFTSPDLATTLMFSDDPLSAGQTPVRAVHIIELRSAISMVRAAAGLTAYPWTDTSIQPGLTLVKSAHVSELRLALDAARLTLGLTAAAYQDAVLSSSVMVRAVHVSELRERVK